MCSVCTSVRIEHISWNGRVLSRAYKLDPTYAKASEEFSDIPWERKAEFRKQMLDELGLPRRKGVVNHWDEGERKPEKKK